MMKGIKSFKDNIGRFTLKIYSFFIYAFLFIPILIVVLMSFNGEKTSSFPITNLSLRWYKQLLGNSSIWSAFSTSLFVAFVTTVISLVLGIFAAYAIVRHKHRFKSLFVSLILAPMLIPALITGIAMLLFYNFLNINPSLLTVIIGHVILTLPYTSLILTARMEGFDLSLEEAARNLGATEFIIFRKIVLPLIMPAIIGGALFAFTISLDQFSLTYFVIGHGKTTLPIKIFSMLKFGITPEINAISTIVLFTSIILVIIAARVSTRDIYK